MIADIEALAASALARIASAENLDQLEVVRVEVLGRKGSLADFGKLMGKLSAEDRVSAGKALNGAKTSLEAAFEIKKTAFDSAALNERLQSEWFDPTIPPQGILPGSLHPLTQIQNEIESLFFSMGFTILDGPEVETEFHNFDALNIPADHPARDMQDTFWLEAMRCVIY